MTAEKLMDVAEFSARAHVSVSFIHHETAARRVGFMRLGRRLYFTEMDLQEFLKNRRVEPVLSGKQSPRKASTAAAAPGRRSRAAAGSAA